MPVGAGSLKRTAKSVSTSKTEEAQVAENVEAKKQPAAKKTAPKTAPKTAAKTAAPRKKPAATVKKEEQIESTSSIKCELPVYLL